MLLFSRTGRVQNGKLIKRSQIGVHGLKIGPIGVIFQGASFLASKKSNKTSNEF